MAAETIAGALDADDDGVVEEPVEQRGGDDGVAEHLAPFGKAAVGGEDHGATLVAGVDQLKEQVAAAGDHRQVANLVDDEELRAAEEPDPLPQGALALSLGQRADELGEGGEVDAASGLDGLDGEGDGQVGLAAAGLAEEVDDLVAADEVEPGQGEDAVAVERGLEREVEPGQRLDGEQPAHLESRLDPAALAQAEFLIEQAVDRLESGDLAALELAQQVLQHFESTRHAQADQVVADAVEGRRRGGHRAGSPAASLRPTAS